MASISGNLFRSGSSSSLGSSSDERLSTTPNLTVAKRTRKRFTGSQLTVLEHLFHRTSHPSREERESLARELNLYVDHLPLPFSISLLVSVFFFFFFGCSSVSPHTQGTQSRNDMVPEPPPDRAQDDPHFHDGGSVTAHFTVFSCRASNAAQMPRIRYALPFLAIRTSSSSFTTATTATAITSPDPTHEAPDARSDGAAL